MNNIEYQHFLNILIEVLKKHGPIKRKYLRANQERFMIKDLYKAIIRRSKLRSKLLHVGQTCLKKNLNSNEIFCVNILNKAKKETLNIYKNDIKSVFDNK